MPRTGLSQIEIKEKAIDVTIGMIRKFGFEKLSLTDVAKEIGVSHAALYSHFTDKSALFDAVSERWLTKIDDELDAICDLDQDPCEQIQAWALALHNAKLDRVRHDPELYKAFDYSVENQKAFIGRHLENVDRQINFLVSKAIKKRKLRKADPAVFSAIIRESTVGFHHPKLVALNLHLRREALLIKTLDAVLIGLSLKS